MRTFERIVLKTKLINYFKDLGYSTDANDTRNLTLFSDVPIHPKSYKFAACPKSCYMTTFGEKEALRILANADR